MSTIGGHLCEGCIINTTCELIIAEIPEISIDVEDDPETGYDELIFKK
jgi:predicted DNA-binding protein with PD1-like motif